MEEQRSESQDQAIRTSKKPVEDFEHYVDRVSKPKIRIRDPRSGEKDPLVKNFFFSLQDQQSGLLWVYYVREEKSRRRKIIQAVGIAAAEGPKEPEVVPYCPDCHQALKPDEVKTYDPAEMEIDQETEVKALGKCPHCDGWVVPATVDETSATEKAEESDA
jgi:hypothetical protein